MLNMVDSTLKTNTDARKIVKPEDTEKVQSLMSQHAISLEKLISRVSKKGASGIEGWKVLFAGPPDEIKKLSNHAYLGDIEVAFKLDKGFMKEVRKKICDHNAEYDAIVLCGGLEDLMEFRSMSNRSFTFESKNRFYPPVLFLSEDPISELMLNVWYIDTRGKDPVLLKQEVTETIQEGKRFVEFVKKAALLIMAKNPADYADLKKRKQDNVHIVPATEAGYYKAKAYLDSIDFTVDNPQSPCNGKTYYGNGVIIGGVAIDAMGGSQHRLLMKLDNESQYQGIPFAYIGKEYSVHIGQFERCMVIPGEEVLNKGLMRLLEGYTPPVEKDTEAEIKVNYTHGESTNKKRQRGLTTRFSESEEEKAYLQTGADPHEATQKVDHLPQQNEKSVYDLLDDPNMPIVDPGEEMRKHQAEINPSDLSAALAKLEKDRQTRLERRKAEEQTETDKPSEGQNGTKVMAFYRVMKPDPEK